MSDEADRSEMHDVAEAYPEKLQELIELWFYEAGLYNGLPIDDRAAAEMVGGTTRPSLVDHSKSQYTYYPNTSVLPESDMVPIRGRSYKFGVFVDFGDKPDGVLFANGSRFGGHSLYVKDGKLKYVNNFIGLKEQMVAADADLPKGSCIVGIDFVMDSVDKANMKTSGTATLYINDQQVAQQDIETQPNAQIETQDVALIGDVVVEIRDAQPRGTDEIGFEAIRVLDEIVAVSH